MGIVFKESGQVEVDGVNAGTVIDVMANYSGRKAEALAAFDKFRTDEIAALTAAHQAAIAKLTTDHQTGLTKAESERDEAVQKLDFVLAKIDHPDIEALRKAKRLAELEKQEQEIREAKEAILNPKAELAETKHK